MRSLAESVTGKFLIAAMLVWTGSLWAGPGVEANGTNPGYYPPGNLTGTVPPRWSWQGTLADVTTRMSPAVFGLGASLSAWHNPAVQDSFGGELTADRKHFYELYTETGNGLVLVPLTGLLFLGDGYDRESGVKIIRLLIQGGLVVQVLKMGIGRPRPFTGLKQRKSWQLSTGYHSYPSGHTLAASTWAFVMSERYGYGWLLLPWAVSVGASRVALDKHYISDTAFSFFIAGTLVGLDAKNKNGFLPWPHLEYRPGPWENTGRHYRKLPVGGEPGRSAGEWVYYFPFWRGDLEDIALLWKINKNT